MAGPRQDVVTNEQLQHLVRMAQEVEALERCAEEEAAAPTPIPFPGTSGRAPVVAPRAAGLGSSRLFGYLAAAACLGLAVGIAWHATTPAPVPSKPRFIAIKPDPQPAPPADGEGITTPRTVEIAHRTASVDEHSEYACSTHMSEIASVVFAISRDMDTDCGDRQAVVQSLALGPTGSISRADLLRLGIEAAGFVSPDRLLVVSVSGPVEALPHTVSEAEALIACMDLSHADPETAEIVGELGHDEAKYAAAARACLSDGVLVEAATFMGR